MFLTFVPAYPPYIHLTYSPPMSHLFPRVLKDQDAYLFEVPTISPQCKN